MELEYLNEFTVIARLESFSRAAEELCMSQSSLSKHVKTLEHAVCKLGLAKAERGADKCQPRTIPLWLQALVKFEGNLD